MKRSRRRSTRCRYRGGGAYDPATGAGVCLLLAIKTMPGYRGSAEGLHDAILTQLSVSGVSIEGTTLLRPGTRSFKVHVTIGGEETPARTLMLMISFDRTSADTPITGIGYYEGNSITVPANAFHSLSDSSPSAIRVSYLDINDKPQEPTFTKWMEASRIQYNKLSWTEACGDFITFLRGPSAWDYTNWDATKLPPPKL